MTEFESIEAYGRCAICCEEDSKMAMALPPSIKTAMSMVVVCDWCLNHGEGKILPAVPYYEWWANGVHLCE